MSRFRSTMILMLATCSITSSLHGISATDDDYHECVRPCSDEAAARRTCAYNFVVAESRRVTSGFCDGFESKNGIGTNVTAERSFLTINGRSPGPAIQICLGDTVEILVHNKLGSDELAFHWHGLRQTGTNHMDGVTMITQCPVLPYAGFRYEIRPESAGTYFYHSHSVSQQGDGLYGSLTVRSPRDHPSLERTLLLSSRSPVPLTAHSRLYTAPSEILVNGQAQGALVRVARGLRYLLRLINANAHDCPVILSVHGHSLQVLATDGNPVRPSTGTHVLLFPGERLDGVLTADQDAGRYALDVQGMRDCRDSRHQAYILYEDATPSETIRTNADVGWNEEALRIAESGHRCHKISKSVICSMDLRAAASSQSAAEKKADQTIYVPYDTNMFPHFTDEMTDNSYNFYVTRYYPAYLSLQRDAVRIPQINDMSFKYPSSPILSHPENAFDRLICSLDKRSVECADTPLFCECLQIIQLPWRKTVDVVLIDQGFGGNVSHTFHSHGYNVSVVGRRSLERPVTRDEIVSLDVNGKLHRNLVNPVRKDTFVVPNKGYVILRFYTDNLGYWLWEARSTSVYPSLLGSGMQFLVRVGLHQNLPPVPINFPTCGSNKGQDLIFEDN